jgi:hypothetical protein
MLNIHQGACPIMMLKKSYSISLFSVLICFSSKIYVHWNVGCDNHMIHFANVDFELPDRLDGNVLIGTLMHWHSWHPCNFFSGIHCWGGPKIQCYDSKIHSWHVHYTGYRWTTGSENDFSTVLFQIVPKTQTKLPIDNPWLYQKDEKRVCFTHNDAMVRISWVLEHNFILFIPCLELCSCCLMLYRPPPHCNYNQWKEPHESITWIIRLRWLEDKSQHFKGDAEVVTVGFLSAQWCSVFVWVCNFESPSNEQ